MQVTTLRSFDLILFLILSLYYKKKKKKKEKEETHSTWHYNQNH